MVKNVKKKNTILADIRSGKVSININNKNEYIAESCKELLETCNLKDEYPPHVTFIPQFKEDNLTVYAHFIDLAFSPMHINFKCFACNKDLLKNFKILEQPQSRMKKTFFCPECFHSSRNFFLYQK